MISQNSPYLPKDKSSKKLNCHRYLPQKFHQQGKIAFIPGEETTTLTQALSKITITLIHLSKDPFIFLKNNLLPPTLSISISSFPIKIAFNPEFQPPVKMTHFPWVSPMYICV